MTERKPNIVFVLADDMGAWALGHAGNKEVLTPNLDKLADGGIRLENFFCASPVCSPARASIVTGRIPSQHGVHDWIRGGNVSREDLDEKMRMKSRYKGETTAVEYLADQLAYTEVLKEAGYSCALSGKWHLGDSKVVQKGFDRWFTIASGGAAYMNPELVENGRIWDVDKYVTDCITDRALDFLGDLSQQKEPYYLSVHYTAPHSPWERKDHQEDFLKLYDDCPFESVPDVPIHPNQNPDQDRITPYGTGSRRKELIRGYYAAITAMDASIGRILKKIDELGSRENTLIVFMSDNGMNLGQHGIWGKGNGTFPLNMFDTSVKVPAIFSHRSVIPQNKVFHDLLSQYDVFPTLLEYAGVKQPKTPVLLPGTSFAQLLKGANTLGREDVVVHDEYGPVRMIRSQDFKYIHRYPFGPHELYDLKKDPNEDVNLVDDEKYKKIKDLMLQKLTDWFAKYVIPQMDGVYLPVIGHGQVGPVFAETKGYNAFQPFPSVK